MHSPLSYGPSPSTGFIGFFLSFIWPLRMNNSKYLTQTVIEPFLWYLCIVHLDIRNGPFVNRDCHLPPPTHSAHTHTHIHTIVPGGNRHMTNVVHSSQINNPIWVTFCSWMGAAPVVVLCISVTIDRPGWHSSIICTTLIGRLPQSNVAIWKKCWKKCHWREVI